jgi:tryptophanyl-tRNA synthetase
MTMKRRKFLEIAALTPLQAEFNRLIADKPYLMGVLNESSEKAARIAVKTLRKVQKKIGFAPRA